MLDDAENAILVAKSCRERNELLEAVSGLEAALKKFPDSEVLRANRNEMRLELLRERAGTDPNNEIKQKLQNLHDHSKWHALSEACSLLVDIHPNSILVLNMLGLAKLALEDFEQAASCFSRVLEIDPKYAPGYLNCGRLLMELGDFGKAADFFNKATGVDETAAEAYTRLGACLWFSGLRLESQEYYQEAERHSQGIHQIKARANLGGVKLLEKNFSEGWALRENRLVAINEQGRARPDLLNKRWSGQHVPHLLIWAEQGIGDEMMFASCFHELANFADKVTITANEKLLPLFRRSFPAKFNFISRDADLSNLNFDAQAPVMTALAALRQSESDFGNAKNPYLFADAKRVDEVFDKIRPLAVDRPIIGISWHSKAKPFGKYRSIALEHLVSYLPEDAIFLNLQYGDFEAEISKVIELTGRDIHTFSDIDKWQDVDGLAALISVCDRVVSIDNAVAHLAGSLGKPCDVMLSVGADWRWANAESSKSYWYPSLTLHWQNNFGDWQRCLVSLASKFQSESS